MSKRILLSTDDPGVGGVAQYNHSILCALARKGFEVTSLHSSPPHQTYSQFVRQQQELGIKQIQIDYSNLSGSSESLQLIRKELEKNDLLICSNSNPFANLIIKQIATEINLAYIIIEGLVDPDIISQFNHQLDQLFEHYSQARSVIAVSQNNLRLLHEQFRLPKSKGQVIYYGRPSTYFTPRNQLINEQLRRALKIPLDAVVCLTSARIEKRKGYQYQLEAIEQLLSTSVWDNLYFIWVGGGIFEPQVERELKDKVKQLKIPDKVKFLGQQEDVSKFLDVADIFILTSELEGMPLSVMEAMSKGLPVIATAVSGIPEELGNTGQLITDPKQDATATVRELCETLKNWTVNAELRKVIGNDCKKRAEKMFKEERMINETVEVIERALLPEKDYVSPGLMIVKPDQSFPNMIVGNTAGCLWPYLRRDIPHNWYVDRRQPTIGFLSRDESQILYNTALKFKNKNALEIGCWMGWSACHLGLAGVKLDVIDPILNYADVYESVTSSLSNAGVLNNINLLAGYSPQKVEELAKQLQKKWSLIFIDGNHESPGPLNDAIACEKYAEEDAMILFHDLASPDVAEGLHYLRDRGWNTMIYQTMQIMGVAWRGNVTPVMHQPDPRVNWQLPDHLRNYTVSNRSQDFSKDEFEEILAQVRPYTLLSQERLLSLYSLAKKVCLDDIPGNFVECGVYKGGGSALLATVIKRYSLRPRFLYAFDTFEGMPDPSAADLHNGIPANQTGFGAGTLGAPIRDNLDQVCQLLKIQDIVKPVPGLFSETLPICKTEIGDIAFLHADGDWYDSTMDIFNNLYDQVVPGGMIQIDDYGHWEGCKKAIHEFEKLKQESFTLHQIDYTGVWFCKGRNGDSHEVKNETQSQNQQRFSEKSQVVKIVIDGVFFQLNNTGIARVWKSLLKTWSKVNFSQQILLLDREGTAPKIPGIAYRSIPRYDYENTDRDRQLLQEICDQEKADLFISTYYTTPLKTPSVFMGYDMIPEVIGHDLDQPMWREKHRGISQASAFITISKNTADDLVRFFPEVAGKPIKVAYCGVNESFTPATATEIECFKQQYNLSKPYFLIVGDRVSRYGYKNAVLLFKAFSSLENNQVLDIVCIGGETQLEQQLLGYVPDSNLHLLKLNDQELRIAYSGAIALVYPSKYEGFGLPIVEAMACGCPVIACRNSSIFEVADDAAIYIKEDDIDQLAQELKKIQNPELRNSLITAGLKQAQKFSWQKMADQVSSTLLEIAEIEKQKVMIVTSIAPGNLEKQKAAIASWKQLGFTIISLNSASEIEQLKSHYQDITFQKVNRDAQAEVGKPLIYLDDIFGYFQDHPCKLCGIINSDIQLQADDNLSAWLLDQAENAMIFGSRIEIETLEQRQGELYDKGFDFFFFDPKFLKDFPSSSFCLGLPWWDFWVPLIAWQRGWTLKNLVTPIAYHLQHSVNYHNDNWQKYGIEFTKFFNGQLSHNLKHLKQTNPNQLQGQLIQIANQFLSEIHKKSIPINYQNQSSYTLNTMKSQATPINLTRLSQSQWTFPTISPLNTNLNRPFWSVMIPTFNKVKYLEQTLRSVLEQAPGDDEMQIEVINDCPDQEVQAELEAIVKKVGGNRVKFYRHSEQNIGQTAIFNLCLEQAQGHWIHLLHDDDFVLPGFYKTLQNTIDQEPHIGAIFCRHFYVDSDNRQCSISDLEQETAGILDNWLERIAVSQRIQPSSIVVKRSTYEQLGGFCPEAKSAADWEMWTRISAHYSIGYEPQILAAYRLHLSSWTSRLIQTGGNIADTRQSIEISQSYLPPNQAVELSNKAKEHYAFYALNTAKQMLNQGEATAVIAQIQEALKCSQSLAVKEAIIQLFTSQKPQLKTFTPAQILAETSRLVGEYRHQPNSDTIVDELRKIRLMVAQYWLGLEAEKLEKVYLGEIGQAHQILLNSGIKNELLTPQEQAKVQELKTYLEAGWNQPKALQKLLALMLYCYSHQLPSGWYVQSPIPKWFLTDYFKYMLAVPQYFQELGEADRYYRYIQNWLDYTTGRFFSEPNFKLWQEIAWLFTQTANFIPLYFNTANLKNIYIKRAEMMTFALKSLGHQLEYKFPNRPTNRSKIRLGILSNHFSPQTETYSTLPVFEHLDRTQFEVILYAIQSNNHPLEQYCSSRVDRFVKLPKNLPDQVQLIRNDDLDILLIGSNVTAVTHSVTLLALHRLARIQVTSTSSCVTTGMPNIDCYISGTLTEPQQNAQEQYQEKLVKIEGTAHCFSYYSIPPEPPKSIPNRASLGISDDTVVFISGANFYKIIPEVRETWAKILATVPNSVLVLYPFNPNWTSQYAGIPFIKQLQSTFAQYKVESQRLIFLQPQPSRADIKEYLKLADIYLDSYPFSGVNSLVDPLEVSLVPIVQDGDSIPSHSDYSSQSGQLIIVGDGGCFRSLMGASLLRSLSIPDLIANSEEAYINLAVTLAKNPQLRQQKRQEIQQKMQQNPEFLDSRTYSVKMGQVFQQLIQTWQQEQQSWQLDSPEALQQYLSKLVNAVNAYDLNQNHELVITELRKIRQVLADYWLTISPERLESMYQSDLGKGYQILLNRGIQREPLTETEQHFLVNSTQQAIGLKQENSLNCLMVCMLYYPPGRMLVQDAEKRLPHWLIKDYKQVFETSTILEKVQPIIEVASASIPATNSTSLTTEAFRNRLLGCVNLYRIDPTNSSVIEDLRQIRQQIADFWLTVDASELTSIYQSSVRPLYHAFLKSGFYEQSLTESEQQFFNNLVSQISQKLETSELMNFLLATLLYCRPGQIKITDISRLPEWFREDYLKITN